MATERIPLTQPIESRTGSFAKDSYSANCFFEMRDNKRELIKRPGLVLAKQIVSGGTPVSQGLYAFNNQLIAAISDTIYKVDPTTPYAVTTLGTTTASISSTYFAKTYQDNYLLFHNRYNLYVMNNSYTISSPTIPFAAPFVCGAVFLDDYLFVGNMAGVGGNRIYNCNQGDPNTWDALSYYQVFETGDQLVSIVKHLNYLVAFGTFSTQFLYNNGTTPGSPLGIAQSYTSEIGCANGDSVAASSNTVLWIGTSKSFGKGVYIMDGVSPVKVSTNAVDKHIEADDLSKVYSYIYSISGHTMYVLTLHSSNKTLVYDLNEKMWYTWTMYTGTQEGYFRPTYFTNLGSPFCLDDDNANLYYLSTSTYQDNGQPIYCRTVTDNSDNGSTKRKFYGRLEIIGDKVAGTLQVRHSGDDYNTWSNYRSIDLNASRAQIYLSGADRRRAWEFLCTSNVPLRLDGAEIDFRIGEMDQEQQVGGGQYRR